MTLWPAGKLAEFISGCYEISLLSMPNVKSEPVATCPLAFQSVAAKHWNKILNPGAFALCHKRYEGPPGNPWSGLHFRS